MISCNHLTPPRRMRAPIDLAADYAATRPPHHSIRAATDASPPPPRRDHARRWPRAATIDRRRRHRRHPSRHTHARPQRAPPPRRSMIDPVNHRSPMRAAARRQRPANVNYHAATSSIDRSPRRPPPDAATSGTTSPPPPPPLCDAATQIIDQPHPNVTHAATALICCHVAAACPTAPGAPDRTAAAPNGQAS